MHLPSEIFVCAAFCMYMYSYVHSAWAKGVNIRSMFSVIHDPSVSKICHIQHHYMLAGIVWCGGAVFCIRCAFRTSNEIHFTHFFFPFQVFSCISLAKSTNTQNNNHIKQGNGSFD